MAERVRKAGGLKYGPHNTIKDVVNDCLIYLQSNGLKISERPRLDMSGTYLIKFTHSIIDPTKPVTTVERNEIVDIKKNKLRLKDRLSVLFKGNADVPISPIEPVFETKRYEVDNTILLMRGWFIATPVAPARLEIHLERVPALDNYTPAQRRTIDAALHRSIDEWKASRARWSKVPGYKFTRPKPTLKSLQDGNSIIVNHRFSIPLEAMDSILKFKKIIREWI